MAGGVNNPPRSGIAHTYYIQLRSASDNLTNLTNPTIAAGDFKVCQDDGTESNLSTLPSVSPASSGWVKLSLTAAEFTGNNIKVRWVDQTNPKEWADGSMSFPTTA